VEGATLIEPRTGTASVDLNASTILEMSRQTEAPSLGVPDTESRAWLSDLQAEGVRREEAVRRLHALLLRASRFEINRRRGALPHLRGGDLDDLAHQAADDALVAVLAKLDGYRGESRFTTWAYKFGLLEAAVKLRRRAWQGREIPLEPEQWGAIASGGDSTAGVAESRATLDAIRAGIETELSPHQRRVLVAVALNEVPIDVLAERLETTRGALYKTIHDARQKLRAHLDSAGLRYESELETSNK
jgi:RNA polymerase sigma-70 factor (ECF subfamily)